MMKIFKQMKKQQQESDDLLERLVKDEAIRVIKLHQLGIEDSNKSIIRIMKKHNLTEEDLK